MCVVAHVKRSRMNGSKREIKDVRDRMREAECVTEEMRTRYTRQDGHKRNVIAYTPAKKHCQYDCN